MEGGLFLGIDQGSSATKGALVDEAGVHLKELYAQVPERIIEGQSVRQEPEGLLLSVKEIVAKAKEWAAENGRIITAAGLSCQRSGVLAWHSVTGEVLHPLMTWSDTTTYPIIQAFGRGTERISQITGVPTLPNFAAGKIHTLQRMFLEPSVHVATLDTFLLHRLSNQSLFVTEDSMAARTMLYALDDGGWSGSLCRDFGVDQQRLPAIRASLGLFLVYDDIPLVACMGDAQAGLIGRSAATARPLINFGTVGSLAKMTGERIERRPGLYSSVLFSRSRPDGLSREKRYLTELTCLPSGSVLLEPLRRKWVTDSRELNGLCEAAYREHPLGRATAYFVGHREVPEWPDGVPNVMVCKPDATDADRARALVENVGNLFVRMLEEFADKGLLGEGACEIDLAGGASELDYLIQYIADVSGHTFHRLAVREASARGAALAAWMATRGRPDAFPLNSDEPVKTYHCQEPERRRRYLMWQRMEQDVLRNSLPPHAVIERGNL
jgi:glycerol kinase